MDKNKILNLLRVFINSKLCILLTRIYVSIMKSMSVNVYVLLYLFISFPYSSVSVDS